jgi:G:T/U-mismatch repair DNA glycosylase
MTNATGRTRQRTISVGFKDATLEEIKAKNPTLTSDQVQKVYQQVTSRRKIDWGALVSTGIKLLVAAQ